LLVAANRVADRQASFATTAFTRSSLPSRRAFRAPISDFPPGGTPQNITNSGDVASHGHSRHYASDAVRVLFYLLSYVS
jgi:hypothetical protein